MRVKILDISPKDAHFDYKENLVGMTGEVIEKCAHGNGWSLLELMDCNYDSVPGRVPGYGKNGDTTVFHEAKYEIVETSNKETKGDQDGN